MLLFCSALALFAQPSTDLTKALTSSRHRIDAIDDQIVKLLNERAQVVRDVGLIKKQFHAPRDRAGARRAGDAPRSRPGPSAAHALSRRSHLQGDAARDVVDGSGRDG